MRRSPLDVMKCERGRDHVMADLGPPHAEGRTLQDSCEKHVCLCVCVCVCVCWWLGGLAVGFGPMWGDRTHAQVWLVLYINLLVP